jgi:hypothetical protein
MAAAGANVAEHLFRAIFDLIALSGATMRLSELVSRQ